MDKSTMQKIRHARCIEAGGFWFLAAGLLLMGAALSFYPW